MSKAEIALYVELVIAVLFSILSIVNYYTKGVPVQWSYMTSIFVILSSSFLALEKKNKETEN